MSALTSLLVRDQVVSVRKIEEAIQRQVVAGGDLESVLLEMEAIPENVMSAYRAALFDLLPATRDEVMRVGRETIRLVPREVAEQYRMIPLHAEDRTLVVAVTAPLSAEDDQQLGFLLNHDLVYRIITDVRIAAALSHHYGIEPAPRFKRLAERLRGREAGRVPYVAPAESPKLDRRDQTVPSKQATTIDWDDDEGSPSTQRFPVVPAEVAPSPQVPPAARAADVVVRHRTTQPGSGMSAPPIVVSGATDVASDADADAKGLGKRLRGPLTPKNAVALLAEARERDELLEILFVFARQFFDYCVLFIVHEDIAEGREAFGDGKTSADVRQIAVPLDVPGAFAAARSGLAPVVVDLRGAELDSIVARDLDRTSSQPALILPVAIRKRVVLILYGDRAGEAFELSDLPELLAFLPRMSEALLALIQRKKRDGYAAPDKSSRSELKASATKLGAGAVANENAPPTAADLYRSSKPPTVELTRPVRKASQPRMAAVRREDPLGVLGVPRSAPPPPNTGEHTRLKDTSPDGHAAIMQSHFRASVPALDIVEPAYPGSDEEDWDEEDDEPGSEVVIEYDDDEPARMRSAPPTRPGGESDLPTFARSQIDRPIQSSYALSGTSTDVVAKSRPKSAASERAQESRSSRRAPAPPREREPIGETEPPIHAEPRRVSREVSTDMPSVIVDMGDTIEQLVDDLIRSGPDDEGAAVQALLTMGEAVLPAMVQRFPGPLWFDRKRPHRRLPRGRDVCALSRGFVAFRERAVPYIVSLIESSDADTRFYSTLLAAELISVDFMVPLGQRLFDADPGTQLLAIDVLRYYGAFKKEMEEFLKGIRVEARVDRKDPERRRAAVRALGGLRDAKSLELLVELLGVRDRDLALEAHGALHVLTRHDFGDTPRKWAPWVEKNRDHHRIEWLIDALTDTNDEVRIASSDELKVLTQEYFGFHPSMPKRDREIAQRKYRDWWHAEGRHRFG